MGWNATSSADKIVVSGGIRLDTLTTAERSHRMSLVRGKNTKPEMVVRSLVHRMGFRFRLHDKQLPGCPDLVFTSRGKVIFVHGCFWHRHNKCPNARMPKSRPEFWIPKLDGNKSRDRQIKQALTRLGWEYIVIWECEIKNLDRVSNRVRSFLGTTT